MATESLDQRKKELRKQVKQQMECLSAAYCETADRAIVENIRKTKEFIEADTIFCFVGTKEEIQTRPIIEAAWAAGKRVAVPRCAQKGIMHAYEIRTFDDLAEGFYGIFEPKEDCPLVQPDAIQFGIIPCLSCDTQGYRLGHGGGYYDRYLANTAFPTAVICRDALLLSEVPVDIYDLQMKRVITEAKNILTTTL